MSPDLLELEAIPETSKFHHSHGPVGLLAKKTLPVFRIPDDAGFDLDDLEEVVAVTFRDEDGCPVHGALLGVLADQSRQFPNAVRLALVDRTCDVHSERDPAHIAFSMLMSVGVLTLGQRGAQRAVGWCIADFGLKDLNEPMTRWHTQIIARDAYLNWAAKAESVPAALRAQIAQRRFTRGDLSESESRRCAELVSDFGITPADFVALKQLLSRAPFGFMGDDWSAYGADARQSKAIASLYGRGLSFKAVESFLVTQRQALEAPVLLAGSDIGVDQRAEDEHETPGIRA